jgi:hypothetical protein
MKKLLPLLLMLSNSLYVSGQITTSILKANFGVDGDLKSNYINLSGPIRPWGDDWYSYGLAGGNVFVIDTLGAAAIVDGYTTNPATRMNSFLRHMNQGFYSVANNKLLLDAVFVRDYHGEDSTVFASGSNKNAMTPAMWSTPVAQSIPDKNEFLDAFIHVRRDGPNAIGSDSLWMFGAVSIENTTGNRYFDFELFQTDLVYTKNTLSFSGYGPDAGHTSWEFDAAGNIVTPGDIIFTEEFSSSSLSLVEARIWIKKSDLSITPAAFNWGGAFDGDGSAATYGYANILPNTAGAFYTGLQNAITTWAGPFALVRADNSVLTNYIQGQFMEFSVNLTKLGIDPATYTNNACAMPFKSVLIKSRASTSFTAALKDFIAPFKMFDYPKVKANAYLRYFCGTMPVTTIEVANPIATSTYTWTTTNGNIVGSTTDSLITVDAPGTYYVNQQMHTMCPWLAVDSITILFDPVCTVLDVNITAFKVSSLGNEAILKWQCNNNELAENFVIEYSTDNKVFKQLAIMDATEKSGTSDYNYLHQLNNNQIIIYYRVKLIEKNQRNKYSNTVLLRPVVYGAKNIPLIFPNPSQGETWMSLESSAKASVTVSISDITGRVIKTLQIPVNEGNNLVSLSTLTKQMAGVYIIKIKAADGEVTQKLLLKE